MTSLTNSEINNDFEKVLIPKERHAFLIPMRFIVAILVLLCTFVLYVCRNNLNVAIIAMSKFNQSSDGNSSGSDVCFTVDTNHINSTKTVEKTNGEFDWDQSTQGVILGAFFWSYILFQVVGGRLSEIFGAKWLAGGGIAGSIIVNILTPLVARTQYYWLMLASRVLLGVFQSFVFPACYALFAKWSPDHERSTVLSFPTIGGNIGTIASSALAGYLSEHGFAEGWPSVFYVSGMIAFVWILFWSVLVKSDPKDHRWIREHELKYIQSNIVSNGSQSKKAFPWLKIFTSTPVIATCVIKYTINWSNILFLTKLPSYLKTVFNYSVSETGFISSILYVVMTISLFLNGFIADYIVAKKLMDKTLLRKIFTLIATVGTALCLVAIPLVQCNRVLVITFLIIAMFMFGAMAGGDIPIIADMTNNYCGTVFAIINTIAFTNGFITPLVVGHIIEASDQIRRQWGYVFYSGAAIQVAGAVVFTLFASAEQQEWDKDDDNEELHIERI